MDLLLSELVNPKRVKKQPILKCNTHGLLFQKYHELRGKDEEKICFPK